MVPEGQRFVVWPQADLRFYLGLQWEAVHRNCTSGVQWSQASCPTFHLSQQTPPEPGVFREWKLGEAALLNPHFLAKSCSPKAEGGRAAVAAPGCGFGRRAGPCQRSRIATASMGRDSSVSDRAEFPQQHSLFPVSFLLLSSPHHSGLEVGSKSRISCFALSPSPFTLC